MSETESKQENNKNEVSVSESNQKSESLLISDVTYMNSSQAHNTYADLICREDHKNKKSNPLAIQEMKDISVLRRCRKGETTYDKPIEVVNTRKKQFGPQKDLVEKNLDGSKGGDLQKGKYTYGKKRFDHLGVMKDFSKNEKQEEKFKCEAKKFQTSTFTKRVNDNYKVNPMEILDKKKTYEMNNTARKKVANRTKAFCDYMGSKKTQHLFKNFQTKPVFVDKVTNNPSNMLKKSIMENRKSLPFYGKYKFQHYIVDNKNHVTFVQ
jgi:hypothetical protein